MSKKELNQQDSSDLQQMTTKFTDLQAKAHQRCEKWTSKLFQSSPIIQFLIQEIKKHSTEPLIVCSPCNETRAGGYAPNLGIVLCENNFVSSSHMEDTLAHELIHYYDSITTKMNWRNPLHVACTEIRAANLSKECGFTREIKRGNFGIAKQHQVCVKRRAMMSLMQSGVVKTEKEAELAVKTVWSSCFADTAPFDEIY